MNRSGGQPRIPLPLLAGGLLLAAGYAACAKTSPPQKPTIHTTKAFDDLFGELPPLPIPAPCYAAVVFFPSAATPGAYRAVPVFSLEQGKEERLAVRTVVEGIETEGGGPVDELLREIRRPFPGGSSLLSLSREGGVAKVRVGGSFRADSLGAGSRDEAGTALALTVAQFGKGSRVEVTDEAGTATFAGSAEGARLSDLGPPRVLGLMAIREAPDRPPGVLSVLFDRPVFVEEAAFSPPGDGPSFPGKVYSTGFGMTLEFHPAGEIPFDPEKRYRVRLSIRDGKGRRAAPDGSWRPKEVRRH